MNHLLCFGFGFSARALARRLAGLATGGWRITGTSTSAEGVERIRAAGFEAALFDGSAPSPEAAAALATATHVLVSAPPGEAAEGDGGDPVLRRHRGDLVQAARLQWIGYLSTIGVYGNHDGAWVDESTPVTPGSVRSRRRVAAEDAWLEVASENLALVRIFRLAGIYGPGRSAVDNLRDGSARRIIKPGQVFNRIHVDDIALVVHAEMEGRARHAIYNVTDNEPAPPQDVVAFAAGLLGLPVPPDIPFAEANLSPMGVSFYGENKRVSNALIRSALGVTLAYPTYREGMAGIIKASEA
jgi:nucleoside-diphosphate-sugar epimerase